MNEKMQRRAQHFENEISKKKKKKRTDQIDQYRQPVTHTNRKYIFMNQGHKNKNRGKETKVFNVSFIELMVVVLRGRNIDEVYL